jgi:hypothetical protein
VSRDFKRAQLGPIIVFLIYLYLQGCITIIKIICGLMNGYLIYYDFIENLQCYQSVISLGNFHYLRLSNLVVINSQTKETVEQMMNFVICCWQEFEGSNN